MSALPYTYSYIIDGRHIVRSSQVEVEVRVVSNSFFDFRFRGEVLSWTQATSFSSNVSKSIVVPKTSTKKFLCVNDIQQIF